MARPASDPWSLRDTDFPARGARAAQLKFVVQYATLAPSSRNAQPWLFGIERDQIFLHADLSRWQPVADPHKRDLYISLGCALENLLIALEHFGFGHVENYFPRPDDDSITARIAILDTPSVSSFRPAQLFKAITLRHTNHGRYLKRSVTPGVIRKLMGCETDWNLTLLLTQDVEIKQAIYKLLMKADAIAFSTPAYRDELVECIRSGNFGGPWLLSVAQQFAIAHLGVRRSAAKGDHAALMSAPVFGLISGQVVSREEQLQAGALLERLYLTATPLGLCLQPVSQLLEIEEVKAPFSRLFRAGGVPLMPFRLGYADPVRATPRRPLEEVLL